MPQPVLHRSGPHKAYLLDLALNCSFRTLTADSEQFQDIPAPAMFEVRAVFFVPVVSPREDPNRGDNVA